ncbi:hypothetical protein FHT39_000336 [Mitsuaria sp. BK045]|nr:hypothetical protein [Mitsuaria sp. BK041]MBB3360914.1 hypothetical protein [Mitsuaria sp. BK045]
MAAPRSGNVPSPTKQDQNNRSDQLNPNNDAYWQSRGDSLRPNDWEDRIKPGDED